MLYRYPGVNLENYRYGDELILNLEVVTRVAEFLEVSAVGKARIAGRDYTNERLLQSTGGEQLSVQPNIFYLGKDSVFRIFGLLPLVNNMNGIQLSLTYGLGVELSYGFKFQSNDESPSDV